MTENKMMSYADELYELRRRKAELQESSRRVQAELDEAEHNLILSMQENGCEGFSRNGCRFTLMKKEYPSAIAESKGELFDVMREHGFEHLFSINTQTLNATLKEIKANNENKFPEWLEPYVKVYEENAIQVRKD